MYIYIATIYWYVQYIYLVYYIHIHTYIYTLCIYLIYINIYMCVFIYFISVSIYPSIYHTIMIQSVCSLSWQMNILMISDGVFINNNCANHVRLFESIVQIFSKFTFTCCPISYWMKSVNISTIIIDVSIYSCNLLRLHQVILKLCHYVHIHVALLLLFW